MGKAGRWQPQVAVTPVQTKSALIARSAGFSQPLER